MGNQPSKTIYKKDTSGDNRTMLLKKLDIIAANYVTDLHLNDYEKFKDQEQCNELVVLTSDKIANSLKFLDIVYLKQRTERGSNISDSHEKKTKAYGSTKVLYGKKSKIVDADEKIPWKKRRLCNGIAKFYVRIAQIYAAIVKSINPQLKFKDKDNETSDNVFAFDTHRVSTEMKQNIFDHVEFSLCGKIKEQLTSNSSLKIDNEKKINIKPEFCKMKSHLKDEPGILELEELFKDEYDYDTGVYKISTKKESRERYMKIYRDFYKIFTGNDYKDEESKTLPLFSKIILSDFELCKDTRFIDERSKLIKPYKVSNPIIDEKIDNYTQKNLKMYYEDEYVLFIKYASLLKNFLIKLNADEMKVLSLLNSLFAFIETENANIDEKNETIIIHPELTDEKLNDVAIKAREYILQLYLNCKDSQTELHSVFKEILIIRSKIKNP